MKWVFILVIVASEYIKKVSPNKSRSRVAELNHREIKPASEFKNVSDVFK